MRQQSPGLHQATPNFTSDHASPSSPVQVREQQYS
jgi:hypothetical protein